MEYKTNYVLNKSQVTWYSNHHGGEYAGAGGCCKYRWDGTASLVQKRDNIIQVVASLNYVAWAEAHRITRDESSHM